MKVCPQCGKEYGDANTLCPSDGTALEKKDDSLLGKILADKYRIEERIAEGGMGTVYRGTHVLMDKTVAVKVLRPSLAADEKIVARFSREARAASRISHPHAISVTDFGEADGIVFLVMEYLSGKTLKQLIREEGPLPLSRVKEIVRQIGGALEEAHRQGVVHRDLKSDNIILESNTGTDFAKVLDFGIAKIKERDGEYDAGITAPNLVIGTPQYMSPEQCSQSEAIDSRSDIYSLGIIIYEMLIGHVPFTGESPTVIMLKQLQEPAPSVLEERSDVPEAVARVVARALAKLPENRYQTVEDLVEDFGIAASMLPPSRSPDAPADRIVVPTTPVESDLDERTLVRPRPSRLPFNAGPPVQVAQTNYRLTGLSPWKIIVPSVVGLIVIFAVAFALTRKSSTNSNANTNQSDSGLVADPNSQPVQSVSPPTGNNEAGIPAGGTTQPVNTNSNPETASPSPVENTNDNSNTNTNTNTNQSNTNSNRLAPSVPQPSPRPTSTTEPAAPLPTPRAPTPKPTLPEPKASPTS